MAKRSLLENPLDRALNVAKARHLSPFRYPGGKTWLAPRIRLWLKERPAEFIEPFAGGGIIGLTVAAERLADHVTLVEVDDQVAAVWKTIITDDEGEWLGRRIVDFELTSETLEKELAKAPRTTREKAFQTILRNRTYHGGILAPGASPIKQGEKGKGIKSRWYAQTLQKRIADITLMRGRISFIESDGIEVIKKKSDCTDAVFFIDPPYTAAGKKAGRRLYKFFELDHEALFQLMTTVAGDFLMTYDNADGVRELVRKYGFDMQPVAMKNTHHAKMTELLIGRDLNWIRAHSLTL